MLILFVFYLLFFFFFFFSSRRRHTRSLCDWSSDVCSSDLVDRSGLSRSIRSLKLDRQVRVDCGRRWRRRRERNFRPSPRPPAPALPAKSVRPCPKQIRRASDHQLREYAWTQPGRELGGAFLSP